MKEQELGATKSRKEIMGLALAALGVVYGDIGTSPLYTVQTCFSKEYGMAPTHFNVLGILSLITWALFIVVSLKYAIFIMRSDNRGEGGILALLALVLRTRLSPQKKWLLAGLGIFGAALFYGDGMITPAISVLSAIEGLEVATPALAPFVLPITIVILIGLFLIQRHGTARVGGLFGPIMIVWFLSLALLGIRNIIKEPSVLWALSPLNGIQFILLHRWAAFVILGAVVLAVTGAEALYADMGHFGRKPVRMAWFGFVLPALLLNYYGQGALLLINPAAVDNPFYKQVPAWGLYPMVILAAVATVIASQAVISGAFSISLQAVQLRYLPRMDIRHTSAREIGQVYVPFINWALLVAVIGLVLGFGSSTRLATAYGIAVTGTFICTTVLALVVARKRWHWNWLLTAIVGAFFLIVDVAFFGSNSLKIHQGGWFPLLIGLTVFTLMMTWHRGRELLAESIESQSMPLDAFLQSIAHHMPTSVPGTAVYLTSNLELTPQSLLHNLKHNKVLHERNVLIRILSRDIPYVKEEERLELVGLSQSFYRVRAWYGFQETPNIPDLLKLCQSIGLEFDMMDTSFFLSRETVIPSPARRGMALWRERLFAWMARNSMNAAKFFGLPMNRVVEMGGQIEI
jgi:KUP system potassium uptake protein